MLAAGGTGVFDMSVCQIASSLPRLPMGAPFSSTFEMMLIYGSGRWAPCCNAAGRW